jgi:hypothetical protein
MKVDRLAKCRVVTFEAFTLNVEFTVFSDVTPLCVVVTYVSEEPATEAKA